MRQEKNTERSSVCICSICSFVENNIIIKKLPCNSKKFELNLKFFGSLVGSKIAYISDIRSGKSFISNLVDHDI